MSGLDAGEVIKKKEQGMLTAEDAIGFIGPNYTTRLTALRGAGREAIEATISLHPSGDREALLLTGVIEPDDEAGFHWTDFGDRVLATLLSDLEYLATL